MITIYKYEIPINFRFHLELPVWHEVLSVRLQSDIPFMWVLVDTETEIMKKPFELITTGMEIENLPDLRYVDTFQIFRFNKTFVYHLFEIGV